MMPPSKIGRLGRLVMIHHDTWLYLCVIIQIIKRDFFEATYLRIYYHPNFFVFYFVFFRDFRLFFYFFRPLPPIPFDCSRTFSWQSTVMFLNAMSWNESNIYNFRSRSVIQNSYSITHYPLFRRYAINSERINSNNFVKCLTTFKGSYDYWQLLDWFVLHFHTVSKGVTSVHRAGRFKYQLSLHRKYFNNGLHNLPVFYCFWFALSTSRSILKLAENKHIPISRVNWLSHHLWSRSVLCMSNHSPPFVSIINLVPGTTCCTQRWRQKLI